MFNKQNSCSLSVNFSLPCPALPTLPCPAFVHMQIARDKLAKLVSLAIKQWEACALFPAVIKRFIANSAGIINAFCFRSNSSRLVSLRLLLFFYASFASTDTIKASLATVSIMLTMAQHSSRLPDEWMGSGLAPLAPVELSSWASCTHSYKSNLNWTHHMEYNKIMLVSNPFRCNLFKWARINFQKLFPSKKIISEEV